MPADDAVYFVTDIECDGFVPGENSMLSFATVAATSDGEERGRFECVLAGLPGATPNPDTYAWFQTLPEAWAAATADPQDPARVMADFAAWVLGFGGTRVFAASPVAFDGIWIDVYLRRFTSYGLVQGFYVPEVLFQHTLCLRTYAAAVLGRPVAEITAETLPAGWLGDIEHTHRAIDDALGYAHLLGELTRRSRPRD
jgi:hypothetical protein